MGQTLGLIAQARDFRLQSLQRLLSRSNQTSFELAAEQIKTDAGCVDLVAQPMTQFPQFLLVDLFSQ
jgi:hypothetical protein